MGGVVHGWETGPVSGPAVHVLLVGGFEKLEFAEFALVIEFLHEEEFTRVDHGFHHHVFEPGGGTEFDDRFAVLDGSGHGHGAGHVFSGFERGDGVFGVIRDCGVEVDGIDVGIGEDLLESGVALFDAVFIADFVEGGFGALADGGQFSSRVALVNGDEFGSKTEADDCDAKRLI